MTKLSPEAYLRFPVKVTHLKQDMPLPLNPKLLHGRIDIKFKTEEFIRGRMYTQALRTVRFETLDVDVERTIRSDDILDKYCTPVVEVANKTILKTSVPELTVLHRNDNSYSTVQFVIGTQINSSSGKTEFDKRTWHVPSIGGHRPSRATEYPDWNVNKKCLVVVMFMPPGSISAGDLEIDDKHDLLEHNPTVYSTFASLIREIRETKAAFGILTDEITSFVADFRYRWDLPYGMPRLSVISSPEVELRFFLSLCVYLEADAWCLTDLYEEEPDAIVLGALNDPGAFDTSLELSHHVNKKWFSDFNLYTMQRVPQLWFQFSLWREYVQKEGLKHPIVTGSSITFEPGGFARRHGLFRSPYPYHELPKDTIDSIFGSRDRRWRNATLDEIISSSDSTTVVITRAVRTGPKHFSQVFFGRISGCNEIVCVKLFDERYFPIPDMYDDECIVGSPESRLCALNFSEDLARREESIYDRLAHLQGVLLPHCYGFHLFTLPDGWQCYGVIMERIQGRSLGNMCKSPLEPGMQTTLISQIRHGVRAMRAAGVNQTDWHPGQILCLDNNVVFIDFAFCLMYLGETDGFPPTGDLDAVQSMLEFDIGFNEEIIEKCWLHALDFEY
ncbi:hypothetical protein NM688_g5841 [Phlebia brevispora]|uniref:Uncharacterized protein n=1 Tax=Phlebia brevispora TaxID=194682 RepID=A0ACC1SP36_9APHY|nr:hypothetical protein NM688_g5841 [Phlebia brevispora]